MSSSTPPTPPGLRLAICAPGELWGGVEQHVHTLARCLIRQDVPVHVIVLYDGPLRARLDQDGIAVSVVQGSGPYDPSSVVRIRQILREHRITVLHTHGYKAAVIGALAARLAGARHVRTEHGRVEPWTGLARIKMQGHAALEHMASRWLTDATVFVSAEIQRQSRNRLNTADRVIHNGIEPVSLTSWIAPEHRLRGEDDDFHVGVVGRIAPVKGHRTLLEAHARLAHEQRIHLHVFGTGPLEDSCRDYCRTHGLTALVHFHGFKPNIHDYLRQLDLLAMPSTHEGLPYVLLEALYCGLPVIASAVGGLLEVIEHEQTGLLVPPGQPALLADAIDRLRIDRALRKALARRGRALIEQHFLADTMSRRYLEVFSSALTSPRQKTADMPVAQ